MKTPLYLSEEDQQRLRSILSHQSSGPKPTQDQKTLLQALLSRATIPRSAEDLENRIGFHDRVSLVSPVDDHDDFNLQIVMPSEADPDQEMISALLPVSLAVLGRRCGDHVSWEVPHGSREMRVTAVAKAGQTAV